MKAVIRAAEVRAAQIFASKDKTRTTLTGVNVEDLAKAHEEWSGYHGSLVWLRFTGQHKAMVMADESKDRRFHALVMPRRADAPC